MSTLKITTPHDIHKNFSDNFKQLRLYRQLTQAELAVKAGVTLSSLKRFEQGGAISSEKLIKLIYCMDAESVIEQIFTPILTPKTIKELKQTEVKRKRVRKYHETT